MKILLALLDFSFAIYCLRDLPNENTNKKGAVLIVLLSFILMASGMYLIN